MGEYTTKPDVFSRDKLEAKWFYQEQVLGKEIERTEEIQKEKPKKNHMRKDRATASEAPAMEAAER